MAALVWTDDLVLGLEPMDVTHQDFVRSYQCLAEASTEAFLAALDDFVAHCEAHFEQENRWMEAVDFPGCHRAEHDRVLAVLRDVRRCAAEGDTFLGRRLIEEIPAWFENHANGMDAALVFHLDSIGYDAVSENWREARPEKPGHGGSERAASSSACTCTVPVAAEGA
ncbi:MAG: cation-binding hemerythrin HHE [Zoogloeaceae bacterium]|nr:cation-binding hemerythrin HHE [Zoogloeaceae bacterium]